MSAAALRVARRGRDRLEGRQACLDEQLEFAVDAFSLEDSGIGRVSTSDHRDAGIMESLHRTHRLHESRCVRGGDRRLPVRHVRAGESPQIVQEPGRCGRSDERVVQEREVSEASA